MPVQVKVMSAQQQDAEAIRQLREAVLEGGNWYRALLDAVRRWASHEEEHKGRHYQYLIDQEAFDWLALAERLCQEIEDLVPQEELVNLLCFGRPPLELSRDEFRNLIGTAKYRAYLNFLYGILVEQMLVQAVVEEIRKERRVQGLSKLDEVTDGAYRRVYGYTRRELLNSFRKERRYPGRNSIFLDELKEFTYWLFKQRIKKSDKSRVASDTKKALATLHHYSHLARRSSVH
ncbi:MAG: hypothetical protein ACOC6A_05050 [Chloroflexota bacterium]